MSPGDLLLLGALVVGYLLGRLHRPAPAPRLAGRVVPLPTMRRARP